ncbi:GntR family transcriptional regulator [Arsenicitalea aurantiaca]|uniref:GntR family transcriptional regulator n=1 Tax=Arsenicitalea aurantiaca TaxID=1783274 RepID=A0A433XKF7_9HYPH|nr:GntR family transcriptional regulator [Arsenicitalea aurantiaca]RUT34560.1 GntR family transcriptional regulator [Arsenicitalea aurantiaca]
MPSMPSEPFSFARLIALNEQRPTYPKSLVELAYEQLLGMLVTMKIQPGAHIGIEALARELQISPTPIREALTLLEAQKLAHKIPNVGFRAAPLLSSVDVDSLFEIRMLLEPAMAALAAERASPEMLERLAVLARELETAAEETDLAYANYAEGDAKLHHLIATASGNRFIAETIEGLHVHLHIFRFLFNTNAPQQAVSEHGQLIEALLRRDGPAAETAMREHLLASRQRIDSVIEERLAAVAKAEAAQAGKAGGRSGRGRPRKPRAAS